MPAAANVIQSSFTLHKQCSDAIPRSVKPEKNVVRKYDLLK